MSGDRRRVACLVLLWLAGCDDQAEICSGPSGCDGGSSNGHSIVGDWIDCIDADCATLRNAGFRFTVDGHFAGLRAPGDSLEPGELYCVMDTVDLSGTYVHDGEVAVLSDGQGLEIIFGFRVEGQRATRRRGLPPNDLIDHLLRIDPPREYGVCEGDVERCDGLSCPAGCCAGPGSCAPGTSAGACGRSGEPCANCEAGRCEGQQCL